MKHTITLIIALALGAAAAFANWLYLSQQTSISYFEGVRVASEINAGDVITEEFLEPINLHVTDDTYPSSTFLPYSEMGLILNRRAQRKMEAFDLILKSDIVKEKGPPPQYEDLGPFKVLAVGDQFVQNVDDEGSTSGGDIITLAVPEILDAKTRRLIEILDPRNDADEDDSGFRIVGVFVYPRSETLEQQETKRRLPLNEGEVAIFVSLSDVQIVPKVLMVGDRIGFHVPKPMFGSLISEPNQEDTGSENSTTTPSNTSSNE